MLRLVATLLILGGIALGINAFVGSHLLSTTADAWIAGGCVLIGWVMMGAVRWNRRGTTLPASISVAEGTHGGREVDLSSLMTQLQGLTSAEGLGSLLTSVGASQAIVMSAQAGQPSMTTGSPGTARIDRVTDTGVKLGDTSLLMLELAVEVNGQRYQATTASMVPTTSLDRAVVGATVQVRADPAHPSNVAVVWA